MAKNRKMDFFLESHTQTHTHTIKQNINLGPLINIYYKGYTINISNIRMHKNYNLKYFESFSFKINFAVLLYYHLTLYMYFVLLIVICILLFYL